MGEGGSSLDQWLVTSFGERLDLGILACGRQGGSVDVQISHFALYIPPHATSLLRKLLLEVSFPFVSCAC